MALPLGRKYFAESLQAAAIYFKACDEMKGLVTA